MYKGSPDPSGMVCFGGGGKEEVCWCNCPLLIFYLEQILFYPDFTIVFLYKITPIYLIIFIYLSLEFY